jgi:prepilin-type N-terminal cleavage/methylation domain-containing protein
MKLGLPKNQRGFTLLEVMIAFALITIILFVAVLAQSSSVTSGIRAKNILMATNLAKNFINQQEVKYEGVAFDKLPKKEEGDFPEPHKGFKWELSFEEVDFGVLSEIIAQQAEANKQDKEANTDTVMKLFEDYLKKSVRRMKVTIHYPDSGATSSLSFTQLLVNYDADFAAGM